LPEHSSESHARLTWDSISHHPIWSAVIAGLIVAAIVGLFHGIGIGGAPNTPGSTSRPAAGNSSPVKTSSEPRSPTLVPMSSPATSTSTLTSSAPPTPESDYLFNLTPIDGAYEVGSKSVNGQTFGRSIFHGLSECNSGEGYSVEYDIGRQYSTFTATAGLSDLDTRGARTVQFRIDTDRGHDYFTSGRGESHKVSFDIRGSLFLRLTVYEPNGSGPCIVDTVAVWGDAQIHH
jgi:NPCBM/NEW2 domain